MHAYAVLGIAGLRELVIDELGAGPGVAGILPKAAGSPFFVTASFAARRAA